MEEKYKSGFIVMKALPPTKGHLYLIDTALENSEKVTLLVCSLKSEPIPGDLRFNWIKEIYQKEDRITIVNFKEEVPQYPEEHPDFWNIWVNISRKYCPDADVIFTSENYGDPYAEYLGIKHHLVDLERKKFPISGTKARSNPFNYWNYIPDNVKPFFVKKIVIMGPESVGKSTLTERLSGHFHTNHVREYGRDVCEKKNGNLDIDDFLDISKGRQKLEDEKTKKANKYLFLDTEDITTYVFSKIYCPENYKKLEDYFISKIDNSNYDLYILLSPDCDSIQDGTRTCLDIRNNHFNSIELELKNRNRNYIIVGGTWENRFLESLRYIYYYNI
jgi:NadR type nicotinamide-nucleotide adenylyltransferase